jgi:RNA 3'-terminal phosphate cyclase
MPSLSDFHDQDLRDTAVTWLALAGNDEIRIASITGHSLGSIKTILKHYLGMHPELARSAIARLVAWYDEQGEG